MHVGRTSLAGSRLSLPLPTEALGVSKVQHPSPLPARRLARLLRPLLLMRLRRPLRLRLRRQKPQPVILWWGLLWRMRRHEKPLLLVLMLLQRV